MVALFESSASRALLAPMLARQAGVESFRKAEVTSPPTVQPLVPRVGTLAAGPGAAVDRAPLERLPFPAGPGTAAELAGAFRTGATTPIEVARKLMTALRTIEGWTPQTTPITAWSEQQLTAQARASTERWSRGAPLSALDGVPVSGVAITSTAITAPPIAMNAEEGDVDLARTSDLMRYAVLANMTGHPALTVPVGRDGAGLPVGFQLIGRFWEEDRLLQLGAVVEQALPPIRPDRAARLLL